MWEPRVGHSWRRAAIEQARQDYTEELKNPGAFLYLHDPRTED